MKNSATPHNTSNSPSIRPAPSANGQARRAQAAPSASQDKKAAADAASPKQSRWPLLLTVLLIGGGIAAYFFIPSFQQSLQEGWQVLGSGEEEKISEWVSQFGAWGPLFIILAMVAQMFLLVVNVVALMLVAILAYGPFWGSALAIAAVLVASTIGWALGRSLGEAGVVRLIGQKAEKKVSHFMDRWGVWAIIIARVSPFLSNDAVSFVAGLARMSYLKFIGATLAGITPLTILLAWLGENNERLKTGLIWVSAISIAALLGYMLYSRLKRGKANPLPPLQGTKPAYSRAAPCSTANGQKSALHTTLSPKKRL
ncbi:TVP38/TMEM64 family protein [Cesiribacter andamanensis]|uniref:TVP38/TMEM64 family membrane protein n=1 Tax=Cesiribacter andamanensis AMV16 TaxID=1279009 RepID=M7NNM3_9BACT|nr:TVP38/TMEM64 family protein [Cesiribacter andamanensis]EMR03305.1 TVP38/TMEM64 family inner membrane protein ydjZ [Cesiribacter andamanensis AMV16]